MKKALKITAYVVGSLLVLLLLAILILNTGPGKNFTRARVEAFLQKKLGTEVKIGGLDYRLPKMLELQKVFVRDQNGDTLLWAGKLRVDMEMTKLFSNQVKISEVHLENAYANLYRNQRDTAFNFDFVVNAFVVDDAAADTTTLNDTTARMKFDIQRLLLDDVRVNFLDNAGGSLFAASVDALNLKMNEIDVYNMIYDVKSLDVKGLNSYFTIAKNYLNLPDTSTTTAPIPDIRIGKLDLQDVVFGFNDSTTMLFTSYKVGRLQANPEKIDLPNQRVDAGKLFLANAEVKVLMDETGPVITDVDSVIENAEVPKWYITAKELKIDTASFVLNNENVPKQPYGIDYNHMNVQNIVLDANDIYYSLDTITGDINKLALQEQSGLHVKQLNTQFAYTPQGAYLRDLYLETPNTRLKNYAELSYPSLEALTNNPSLAQVKLDIDNSVVGMKDVLLFAPDLRSQDFFRKYGNDRLNVSAQVTGRLNDLDIRQLNASGIGGTFVNVSGKLKGLPDANKVQYDFDIRRLESNATVVNSLLPASVRQQINIPNTFSINGKLSGNTSYFNTNLAIRTSQGYAWTRGYVDIGRTNRERYDMHIRTDNLNIGNIMRIPDVGRISAVLDVKGTGFDPKYANANISGIINSAGYNGYTYRNVSIKAAIAKQQAEYDIKSDDPNAHMDIKGTASFSGQYPAVYATLNVDSADLQKLGFSTNPLRIRGMVYADVPVLNPDYPEGTIMLDGATVVSNGERMYLDSAFIVSKPSADSGQYITIDADGIQARITGKTPLTKIGSIIQSQMSRYMSTSRADSIAAAKASPATYSLNLNAQITDGALLRSFVPDLKKLDTANITANINQDNLFLQALFPQLVYGDMTIDSGRVDVNGSGNTLSYSASAGKFFQNGLRMWQPTISGTASGNTITGNLHISDSLLNERFVVDAVYHQHGDTTEIHVNNPLKLNYEDWQVAQPNRIMFGKNGINIQNFRISHEQQSISANSTGPSYASPIDIAINDFLISSITEIFQSDTLLANGLVNGKFTIQDLFGQPKANGNLTVANLSAMGDTLGNLALQLQEASANSIGADATLTGRGNDIRMAGRYYPNPVNGNSLDLNIDLKAVNVASMEGLAMNQIRNTSGFIRGNLQVKGTLDKPQITGVLRTDKLATTVSQLGAYFLMPSEEIEFTKNGIEFKRVKIIDSAGNMGYVDGRIITSNYRDMTLALEVKTDRFQVLNSTSKDNEIFYGDMVVSSNLFLNGDLRAPSINGSITIHDSTKMTVEVPKDKVQLQEREGIVEFVDMDHPNRHLLLQDTSEPKKMMPFLSPTSAFNVNIDLNKNAEFTVILDQGTGDFLKVQGEASLNTYVAPDGTLALSGNYELVDGAYELNYNFIRRRFDIQKGSRITFAGDPTDAVVNVKAVYLANVPPYELVEQQLNDKTQLNYYKQRIPFNVVLQMKGDLMRPEISFDIELPEDQSYRVSGDVLATTRAKLAQIRNSPSELNKQVFAVLILNRFVAEDPFSSETGISAEYIARQSASRFISEQLNRFASQLIQGFELTFDLQSYEDYTTGSQRQRTDLSVAASKRLLNDRLKITVGQDFGIEGGGSNKNSNTNLVPGNIAADYQLSQDGRYMVRFYRRNENEGVAEGFVVETGASFIVTLDYNRFKDIFIRRNKKQDKEETKPRGAAN